MKWAENLPEQCPPEQAAPPDGDKFYRFISAIPIKEDDFYSQKKLKPLRVFKDLNECITRSVSLFNDLSVAKKKLLLPAHRGKKILEITLPTESGVILQTLGKNHISWWRAEGFIPTSYTLVE